MKKNVIISIISLIVIVFSFAACGEKENNMNSEIQTIYLPELQCHELLCAIGREGMVKHPMHAGNNVFYWLVETGNKHIMLVNNGKKADRNIDIREYIGIFPENDIFGRYRLVEINDEKIVIFKDQDYKVYSRSLFRI